MAIQVGSVELQQLGSEEDRTVVNVESDHHHRRARELILDSADPPSIFREVYSAVKSKVSPGKTSREKNRGKTRQNRVASFFVTLFPILRWGRTYKASMFRHDLMAGLTLASLCIPQSIGYANLAKLDPQYGLYTSVVPPLIYALMGSSRDLAIGPVAVVSLLLSSMVPEIQDPDTNPIAYAKTVFTVTFFAGLFQAAFGFFRLGFLVDFLSHAAIVGFMAGAAIVIGLQQLKGLIGITHFTTKTDVVSVMKSVFHSIFNDSLHPLNFVIGCSFLIFLLLARQIGRRNKKLFWLPALGPLVSVILSTLIVYLTKADQHGVKIVKHVHGGLNPSSARDLQFSGPHVAQIAKTGLICAVIALTEAIAVGRSFASIKGYHLDGNTEMVAMGFMNIAGSLSSCYVATGSFSRTAVNFSAGCETVVSNIVMALTVLVSLELMTKLLYYTPMAILASVILSALPGLVNVAEARHLWKVDKLDFLACAGAFFGVLFVSVEIGLLVAVGISLAKILLHAIRPGIEVLGTVPGTNIYCEASQYPMASKPLGVLAIRIDSGLLCFANANFIRQRIMRLVEEEEDYSSEETVKASVKVLVLDMSSVTNIDTSGISALEEVQKKLLLHGIGLALASPKWQVVHKLKLANFVDKIGRDRVYLTVAEAVESCLGVKSGHVNC